MMAVNTLAGAKKQSVPMATLGNHVGEMDADEIASTVMNSETRTLKKITMEDATKVATTFMNLMGESVIPRKQFIEARAQDANIDV